MSGAMERLAASIIQLESEVDLLKERVCSLEASRRDTMGLLEETNNSIDRVENDFIGVRYTVEDQPKVQVRKRGRDEMDKDGGVIRTQERGAKFARKRGCLARR